MNIRKNARRRVREVSSLKAPASAMQVLVNPAALMDGEVRAAMVQMAQDITTQAQAITLHATREGASWDKPHDITIASRLKDFPRMNPAIYLGCKINEGPSSLWMRYKKFSVPWVLIKRRRMSWRHTSSRMWFRYGKKVLSWPSWFKVQD